MIKMTVLKLKAHDYIIIRNIFISFMENEIFETKI